MVLRPSAPCRVVGMEVKDLGLLRGHLARDSAPCPVAGTEEMAGKEEGGMKSRSICASTIDQRIHTSIDTNMLCLAMP